MTFREYIFTVCNGNPANQVDLMFKDVNGGVDMSFIAKQENLNNDIEYVTNLLNIPFNGLPYLNVTSKGSYLDKYNDDMADAVHNAFARDIKEFSYSFGDR